MDSKISTGCSLLNLYHGYGPINNKNRNSLQQVFIIKTEAERVFGELVILSWVNIFRLWGWSISGIWSPASYGLPLQSILQTGGDEQAPEGTSVWDRQAHP